VEFLKQLGNLDLMMIKQPLASDDIVDLAKLQASMSTPVCLDENIQSLKDTRKAIELGSYKIINTKIGRVDDLIGAKKILDYCFEHNIDIWSAGCLRQV